MNIFYYLGYYRDIHPERDRFFLSIVETEKKSSGLGGYCKTISNAIEKTDHFIPFRFDKKKLAEEFEKEMKNRPGANIYYIAASKVKI